MNTSTMTKNISTSNLSDIRGLRLQPLIELKSGRQVANEVLTWLHEGLDAESWFSGLPSDKYLAIFIWQVDEVMGYEGNYWLNLPVKVLSDPFCVSVLMNYNHRHRLTIEIQDPESTLDMNSSEIKKFNLSIKKLRELGWHIWLDDLSYESLRALNELSVEVDGVKIDRKEIRNTRKLKSLIDKVSEYNDSILVEGIEEDILLTVALNTGAWLGQGYLWHETKIPLPAPRK